MPRIVLKELDSETTFMVTEGDFLLGRDPACGFVVEGPKCKVVSGRHARVYMQDGTWWIEDTSRNGTVLDHERLQRGVRHALREGQVIGLGDTGPRYSVVALESRFVAQTIVESSPPAERPEPTAPQSAVSPTAPQPAMSAASRPVAPRKPSAPDVGTMAMRRSEAARAGVHEDEPSTEPMAPSPDWIVHVVMRATHDNHRYDVRGDVIKIGRAPVCLVQIPADQGASVSRVHSEIALQDGGVSLRDAGSRNGTYMNGKKIDGSVQCTKGDLIMLGAGGPTLAVEELHIVKPDSLPPEPPRPTPVESNKSTPPGGGPVAKSGEPGAIRRAMGPATNLARRSFAGVGRTAFFKDVLEDMSRQSARRVRVVIWSSLAGMVAIGVIVLGMMQSRVSRTERDMQADRVAFQARTDSMRRAADAEASRLRVAFDSARASSAPREVLDSLRNALADASRRTGQLALAMSRARQSLDAQLAAGDSARLHAEAEMTRLRTQVDRAQSDGGGALLDSLRRALREAETRATGVNEQLRAVRGVDLAQVAQLNQGAVGLVTMFADTNGVEGSGFAITPSGYFITNRHVVTAEDGKTADSIFVTMADQRYVAWLRADIVAIGQGELDIAVLKLRHYTGPYIQKVDWTSTDARQGEPAALIGFPRGTMVALDSNDVVRTSMSAGIFSKVTPARIQFDGFSQGGSSGSPVFNASGTVVAVHFAGLRGVAGLGFAIPVSRAVILLPTGAKRELGLR